MLVLLYNLVKFTTERKWKSTSVLASVLRDGHTVYIRYRSHTQTHFPDIQSASFVQIQMCLRCSDLVCYCASVTDVTVA